MKKIILTLILCFVAYSVQAETVKFITGKPMAAGGLTCTHGSGDSGLVSHTGHSAYSSGYHSERYKGLIFTIAATTRFTSIDIWVQNGIGEAMDTTIRIETTSSGLPTNTLGNVNATKSVSVANAHDNVVSFDFDTPFELAAGTYSVTVRGTGTTLGAYLGLDSEAGHFCYSSDSGTNWADDTGSNAYLVVYGCQ